MAVDASSTNSSSAQLPATLDNMIGFSFTKHDFYVRQNNKSWIFEDGLFSEWSPVTGIHVKTWILQRGDSHIRVHDIENKTEHDVDSIEGGFAVSSMIPKGIKTDEISSSSPSYVAAEVHTPEDNSLLVDLLDLRKPRVTEPDPNTNLMASKVMVPQLRGTIKAGSSVQFGCAVYGNLTKIPFSKDEWLANLNVPSRAELKNLIKSAQRVVCNEDLK